VKVLGSVSVRLDAQAGDVAEVLVARDDCVVCRSEGDSRDQEVKGPHAPAGGSELGIQLGRFVGPRTIEDQDIEAAQGLLQLSEFHLIDAAVDERSRGQFKGIDLRRRRPFSRVLDRLDDLASFQPPTHEIDEEGRVEELHRRPFPFGRLHPSRCFSSSEMGRSAL